MTAFSRPLLRPLAALTLLSALGVTSCDDDSDEAPASAPDAGAAGVDRQAALRAIGEQTILPTYQQFLSDAQALSAALDALAADPDDAERRAEAQRAFSEAMHDWQRAELMSVGPAGAPSARLGGLGIRDEIYSWPTVNPCRVDQELVEGEFAEPDFFDGALVNVYGLDAIEYLIFVEGGENACPSPVPINADGSWAALGEAEVRSRRARYAAAAAGHVVESAQALVDAWDPEKGNFLAAYSRPGEGASPYPTVQVALNETFAAMFYLDKQLKDLKLGAPAGITLDCTDDRCPERLESQWARRSGAYATDNLEGFRAMYTASGAGGFDTLLTDTGAGDLAEALGGATAAALETFSALPPDLAELLAQEPETVRSAHGQVKAISDLLKSQFVTVLNLSVPQEGASDND